MHPACVHERDLILAAISDGSSEADSGSHWSLLVIYRTKRRGNDGGARHACVHYDSLNQAPNRARAAHLASLLLHRDDVVVEDGMCSKQTNGYDCGIYMCLFIKTIVGEFCESARWFTFRTAKRWRLALVRVTRAQVKAFRNTLVQAYEQAVHARSPSMLTSIEDNMCACGWCLKSEG